MEYSCQNNNQIEDNLIEYYTKNFNFKKIPPELDFDVKYYASMFLNFIQYLKTPDIKILNFWNKQLKPFLKSNYPVIKNGIFTTNVDIEFLINEIDKFNKNNNPEKLLLNEIKMKLNQRNKKIENSSNINNNKDKNITTNKSLIENEKVKIKNEIRPHSETMASISTTDSLYEINNNFLNDFKDIIEKNKGENNNKINGKNDIIIEEIENEEIRNNKNMMLNENLNINEIKEKKSLTEIVYKDMNPTFIDKDEIPSINIVYQSLQKTKIKLIDANLLLKKIVEDDFSKNNYQILYAFIRQSFYFLKKEVFIKKIINCYKHYKSLNLPLNKLENLIYFLNAYIIEMFLYYKSNLSDSKIFQLLLDFYNELIIENINSIENKDINNYIIEDKNKFLNDKICIQISKIGKNSIKENIENKSLNKISKKLKNRAKKYHQKIMELKKEQNLKREMNKKKTQKITNNLKMEEIDDFEGRKTHYCDNLINTMTFMPKSIINIKEENDYQIFPKENFDINKNERNRSGSIKKSSSKKLDIYKEELTDINDIMKIIGKDYDNIIFDTNLVLNEEKFLFNIKNINNILYKNEYKESEIIQIKYDEIFYENFSFYKKKYKEKKKNNNQKNNIIKNLNQGQSKALTLNAKELKINISQNSPKKFFCVTDWETSQIAEQLINITRNLLNKIEYKELYGALFTKNAKEINSPNIMENIKKFNNLTLFIIEDILSYDFPKDRAKMIDKWVLIAQYCKKRKDQSNCFAINTSLNHYIITGLNLTQKEIKSNTRIIMKEISEYCNLIGNYKVFREEIKNIKQKEFFVPYLGTLLRDFTFFEESGKYLIKGNLINFEKIENVQNSLDKFFKFKDSVDTVKMEKIEELNFFENLENKTEEELENIANQLEPEFKIRKLPLKEKRLTQIDKKYFMNELKRGSCILNANPMRISLK